MKKIKAKLLAGLATLCSCLFCLGGGIAFIASTEVSTITASATTTYDTITHLTPLGSSSETFIYAYPTNESKPGVNSWDYAFSFVTGTGDGFLWNGESYTGWELKQPGDFYIGLGGKTATAGDTLTIDGTFYNATVDANIVFENCGLKYNGSAWESYVPPVVHNIGALELHVNSSVGGAKGLNNTLYLQRKDGEALPVQSWNYLFTYESGNGFQVNGVQKTPSEIKSTGGDGFYWLFDGVNAGDVVSISGTFFCESQNVKYVITESHFKWNGSGWESYVPPVVHNIGALELHVNSNGGAASGLNNVLYLQRKDGNALPFQAWENPFVLESGDGLKVNGNAATLNEMQSTDGGLYLAFNALNAGDVLSISGTFFCEKQNIQYVITESHFKWNGSGWETYVDYATYEIGAVVIGNGSSASAVYFDKESGNAFEVIDGSWTEKLTYESGLGVTLNGTQISMGDIKIPNNLYVGLGTTATTGDVLAIGGTFYNKTLAVKYVIDESTFVWDGSAWTDYIVYTVNAIEAIDSGNAKRVDFLPAEGENSSFLPASGSVTYQFEAGSGDGISLDNPATDLSGKNVTVNATYIRVLWGTTATPVAGTVFTIDGTMYNDTTRKKIVFNNCQLQYDGSAWQVYAGYTAYEIGALELHINSTGDRESNKKDALYLQRADGQALPVQAWENPFVLESGDGLKVNGVAATLNEMQSTGDGLYLAFDALNAGDVLSISGTFVCENKHIKYTITESKFVWNGSSWAVYTPPVEYTVYNVDAIRAEDSSDASNLYLTPFNGDGNSFGTGDWANFYTFDTESGEGLKLNGTALSTTDIKQPGSFFIALGVTAEEGDVLTIDGTYYNATTAKKIVFDNCVLEFNGTKWFTAFTDDRLEVYDTVTILDLGVGTQLDLNGTIDKTGLVYVPSVDNTTGSVKFRFGYQSTDLSQGEVAIRLRGGAWFGVHFRLIWSGLDDADQLGMEKIALNNNQYYVIEIGAIDTTDGNNIWIYVRIDGVIQFSTRVAKTDIAETEVSGEGENQVVTEHKYEEYNTSHVSIYASDVSASTISDPDHVAVTYTTDLGSFIEYAAKAGYALSAGKTYDTFIGWWDGETLYAAGEAVEFTSNVTLTAVTLDFTLDVGAAIRVGTSADNSGIRFTAFLSQDGLNALSNTYGISNVSYGMLILPYDYLQAGQMPNLEDFTPYVDELISGKTIMKFVSDHEKEKVENGVIEYRGAIEQLYESNYERLWAGRGYIEFTLNGKTVRAYTPFSLEDNVRSIREVAQKFQADTSAAAAGELKYASLSADRKAIVDNYAKTDEINLMKYDRYSASFLNVFAWYYPELDPSNAYNNDTNVVIAQKLKAAGMKGVYLDGKYHIDLDTYANIEKTRQIIEFFWSQGLYTIAYGSGAGNNDPLLDYSQTAYPDFSKCEGFIGFLVWDEPASGRFNSIATAANKFEIIYAGSNASFMVNLLPSYAETFNGTSHWWESSLESLDKDAYKAYLQAYCDTVLSQIDGDKKWLSMDSYPINADYTLTPNFLFDLAMTKYYSLYADAHSHAVLQSCGWTEDGNSTKNRMPTEAEMRMQAYAAMAFGIDSISWWSYGDMRNTLEEDNQSNPMDNDDYYTRFANVNNELSAIGQVYSAFDWKGVILGSGKDNGSIGNEDADYEAFNAVKGQIGNYELSVNDTKHLASVSTDKTNWNYLMGVMEDMNGNEGYVLCNYNSHEEDRAQTITLTFDSNVTEVVIYRGGEAETIAVGNKTLTVSLATGEGVIILPSKLG